MRETTNNNGSGFIDDLSRAKAKAIKTPLKFYKVFNACVNKAETIEQLNQFLLIHNKPNVRTDNKFIYSYDTNVATIDHDQKQVIVKNWYSVTTSKHINYIANLLNYNTKKLY
jgi:hypothetical protein